MKNGGHDKATPLRSPTLPGHRLVFFIRQVSRGIHITRKKNASNQESPA
jgi:hypothetical protein